MSNTANDIVSMSKDNTLWFNKLSATAMMQLNTPVAKKPRIDENSESMTPSSSSSKDSGNEEVPFLNIPPELMRKITGYLSFDQLARIRPVCRGLNRVAGYALNNGYKKFSDELDKARNRMKRELPRRESERRSHRLSRLADTYSSIDTRRALLDMTFRKYIENDLTCFIPGKVLDEGFRLLRMLQRCKDLGGMMTGDQGEMLRDLRDLSSMSIEYFEEAIEPQMKPRLVGLTTPKFVNRWIPSSSQSHGRHPFRYPSSLAPSTPSLRALPSWQKSMEEKIKNQDVIIERQSRLIELLRGTVGSLTDALQQVSNYVELPINFQSIRDTIAMMDEDDVMDEEKPSFAEVEISRKRRAISLDKDTE